MYPAGSFFESANEMYQISQYLIQKGMNPNYSDSYDNLNFLINNLQDLCNFVDYDEKKVIKRIDPLIKPLLSESQKLNLINNLKKVSLDDSIDKKIKDYINELQEEPNITITPRMASPNLRVTSSSYRQNALAYARKHGYTNGYYGSTNRKNNAPSPYYDFQKDGYGDCANFVSQCLHAGGVTFWTNNNPWYYYSTSKRSPSWAGARHFKLHWMKRVDYQTLTVKNTLSFLRPATPISICDSDGYATHTLITTDRHSNGYNFSYAAHSDEGKRTDLLKKLNGKLITYYKVYW